ncbi:MAG TPA: hypothetical protein VGF70_01370 [Solirubrobacteraceae bacterium]
MSSEPGTPLPLIAYLDVVLVVLAAPIALLTGVSALGYGIGGGAWLVLRAVGVAVERMAISSTDARQQISLRMAYMLGRLFLLALAVILARRDSQNAGLAALIVVVVAFTIQLATAAMSGPRRTR